MDRPTWRERFRYRFDNFMAHGTPALVLGLFLASILVIGLISLVVWIIGAVRDQPLDFPTLLWFGLMRTLDPGTMGGDSGSPGFLFGMFAITIGGIFIISTLIGVLNTGLQIRLDDLRKGRSRVIETGHTVILGWTPQIFTVIRELVLANASEGGTTIVVLAERDKVEMLDDIRDRVGSTGRTKVVCRSGSPLDVGDLPIVSVATARSIIILTPDVPEPDADVIKILLALTRHPDRRRERHNIVAEIRERSNLGVAELVAGDEAELILSEDVTSRIIAQACRQSGLSVVYEDLFNFEGDEIYFVDRPDLVGRTVADAIYAFRNATVVGIAPAEGEPELNPLDVRPVAPGDRIVVIAEDDGSIESSDDDDRFVDAALIAEPADRAPAPERTLVLGWNRRGTSVLRHLDHYSAPGSEVLVVSEAPTVGAGLVGLGGRSGAPGAQTIRVHAADPSIRETLQSLPLASFDHVIVLCDTDTLDVARADAKALITLLHLRDLVEKLGKPITIVSEMLDLRDRALAEVARADDFIVSEQLISQLISQIAENRHLHAIFRQLLDPPGVEIYLRPASDYVVLGRPVPFGTIVAAARRRGEMAFGYRVAAKSSDSAAQYGVKLNPPRSATIDYAADDRIVVLAEV